MIAAIWPPCARNAASTASTLLYGRAIVVAANAGQNYGALVGFNAGTLIGNTASQRDPSMPLVGSGRKPIN